jgi:hypothetical protein
MEHKSTNLRRVINGNDSWFFTYYPRDSIWPASRDELPQRIKPKISTEECLVSILWSLNGIHSLLDVPKGTTYNTAFSMDAVMPSLIENVQLRTRRKTLKGWLILMDNVFAHNSGRAQSCIEASRAERLLHLASSPDLAPSNFFLFGDIREKLFDYNCESREDLLNAITEIFIGIGHGMLLSVFGSWVNRLKWVIKHEGKCHTKQRKTRNISSRLSEKTRGYKRMEPPVTCPTQR